MVHMHSCIFHFKSFFTFSYIGFSYYLNCDLFGLKQNKCWYKCGRDLNFQYLHRTQTNYENIYYKWWDIGRRGKNSASLNCCLFQSLVHIFFRDDFSFFSSSTHQGFIASICLVHFYHIIWTFYKCHKCVTSNKLFSLNSYILYFLKHNV